MNMVKLFLLLATLMLMLFSSCGISDDPPPAGPLQLNLINTSLSAAAAAAPLRPPLALATSNFGMASAAELSSLQYYIREIRLCKTLQVSGALFSNPRGCFSLYTAPGTDEFNSYNATAARSESDPYKYIDLMSATSLSQLNSNKITLNATHIGSYNYGVISWFAPIKITASVPMMDASVTYYTEDGADSTYDTGASYLIVDDLTTGPASEAVVTLNSGGSWFKFTSPFVISRDDIESKKSMRLGLAFNPDGLIKSALTSGLKESMIRLNGEGTTGQAIVMPALNLIPIPYYQGETLVRETYLFHYNNILAYDVRLELFYVQGKSGTIYGAELTPLYTSLTTDGGAPPFNQIFSISTSSSDSTLSFSDYQAPMIKEFTRLTTAGSSGTAKFVCKNYPNFDLGGCSFLNKEIAVSYELSAIDTF
ncbi:MAG: hypothetical protein HQK52_12215 [Oligoflexia bacterium]|nr:hypothetical protein [Oligoflexia bacterium]